MGKINKLPDHVINQIKAGEVVERPLNVAKELVENSIDAGASHIQIELLDGGKQLIRITDNGCGMQPEDLITSLERHATSKLHSIADLDRILSLGFRGEAIPSIASVSKFSIKSRDANSLLGSEITVTDGIIGNINELTMPVGTSVTVRDLFTNVPARLKFLKATATEFSHIHDYLYALALAYPNISFVLSHNGREVFSVAPTKNTNDRFNALLGGDARDFFPVHYTRGSFQVNGFAGTPSSAKPSSKYFITFVNGRLVRDKIIRAGILQAYSSLIMKGLFPSAILFITIDTNWIDVNVHPAKTELRFRDAAAVQDLLTIAVQNEVKLAVRNEQEALVKANSNNNLGQKHYEPQQSTYKSTPQYSPVASKPAPTQIQKQNSYSINTPTPTPQLLFTEPQGALHGAKILGQFNNCYLLFICAQELWVVDQHAFHERILFEELLTQAQQSKTIEMQELLTPIIISVSHTAANLIGDKLTDAQKLGFHLEILSNNTLAIHAYPIFLKLAQVTPTVENLIANFLDDTATNIEQLYRLCFATIACHTAVRAGEPLGDDTIKHLLSRASDVDFFSNCPHGRPVVRKFSVSDVSAWFLRI